MEWTYKNQPVTEPPDGALGFIYVITHIPSGKRYLGRKQFWMSKTKIVKGKKKRIKVESDWRDYYSSSPDLLVMVEQQGKHNFEREIIMMVNSKSELVYAEEYCLYVTDAMLSDEWLNGNIRTKIMKSWFTKNRLDFKQRIDEANLFLIKSNS